MKRNTLKVSLEIAWKIRLYNLKLHFNRNNITEI